MLAGGRAKLARRRLDTGGFRGIAFASVAGMIEAHDLTRKFGPHAVEQHTGQHGPERQTGRDERDVDRRAGAQSQILQTVVAADADQAEYAEIDPAFADLCARLGIGNQLPSLRQQDQQRQAPAQRVEPQGSDAVDRHSCQHRVARPQQRRQEQQNQQARR